MGRVFAEGPEVIKFLDYVYTNDIGTLSDGKGVYGVMCKPDGGIVDDLIVYRRNAENFLVVYNAGNRAKDFAWLQKNMKGFKVKLTVGLIYLLPLFVAIGAHLLSGPQEHWSRADRSSAGIAPDPAGTSEALVQVYTALIYQGPGLIKEIKRGLCRLLERDGLRNIAEAVGVSVKESRAVRSASASKQGLPARQQA